MKIPLIVSALFFLKSLAYTQKNMHVRSKSVFNVTYKDSAKTTYFLNTKEGAAIINLYGDSIITFQNTIAIDKAANISIGKWSIQNDSEIVVKSNSELQPLFFLRVAKSNHFKVSLF